MTYWALGCVQKCDLWTWLRKEKKGQKLSCIKLAIFPDHPRRHRPLKFCVQGRVREVVIYFKFHENRSRVLGAVGGRKSPSPIDKAHGLYNSLYYRTSRDRDKMKWILLRCDYDTPSHSAWPESFRGACDALRKPSGAQKIGAACNAFAGKSIERSAEAHCAEAKWKG